MRGRKKVGRCKPHRTKLCRSKKLKRITKKRKRNALIHMKFRKIAEENVIQSDRDRAFRHAEHMRLCAEKKKREGN